MRDHHRLPGRSICRPPHSRRTGRSATSREVSLFRVPSAFAGRAVPSRRRPASGPSRCGVGSGFRVAEALFGIAVTKLAPAVFGASRLRVIASSIRGDAARAGHSWPPFLRRTYRARSPSCYRGLAELVSEPGDARGVRYALRSVDPVRGWPASRRCRSAPPAVSPPRRPRVYSREIRPLRRDRRAWRMRLLGSSADQMCHVVRRSRLGFYAQGRAHHDGLDCHGLSGLSRVFVRRPPRRHFWRR